MCGVIARLLPMEPVPVEFYRFFAKHNRDVFWGTLISLAGAACVWAILYGLVYWCTLLWLTIGVDIAAEMPRNFWFWFAIGGVFLVLLRVISWRWLVLERLREDRRYFTWFVLEMLFFAPNMLLLIPGNCRAFVRLSREQLDAAWAMLRALDKEKPLKLSELPNLVPDPKLRRKALDALQVSGLLYLAAAPGDWVLRPKTQEAIRFASGRIRMRMKKKKRFRAE